MLKIFYGEKQVMDCTWLVQVVIVALIHRKSSIMSIIKNFVFGNNDVIFIEYDGLNNKLRFCKNKVEYFEMSIIAPP